jgi:ABC-type multidrug transport system fused ATPase/permease subunit
LEQIKQLLTEGEDILWYYRETKSLIKEPLIHVFIGILLMVILSYLILVIASWLEWILWVVILLLLIPIGLFIRSILFSIKDYRDKIKTLQLSFKKLRHYECIYAITNKRWIQKDFDLNSNVEVSDYFKETIEKFKDIVFVNLEKIEAIYTFEDKTNIIALYIEYNEENPEETDFGVWVSSKEFHKAIDTLKKVIPLENEKEGELGEKIFLRKKKQ